MRKLIVIGCLLICTPMIAAAQWQLNTTDSSVLFGSVKKGAVYETSRFEQFSGHIGRRGIAELTIELASVDTGIDIRDSRMRTMLFNLTDYPRAQIQVPVDVEQFNAMVPGELWPLSAGGKVLLNGHERTVLAELHIYRLTEQRWLVKTAEPVVLNLAEFGLLGGLDALREIAGLDSIMPRVPVSLELVYDRQ